MNKPTAHDLAERLKPGRFTQSTQDKLERTRSRIEPQLMQLLRHRDAFVREVAATILGERRKPESIPALLKAVSDRSPHVAFDAIVAIEKCAGLETGELVSALWLDLSKPRSAARPLAAWWRIVRRKVLR
jgi:HEAT repeat protein